MILVFFLPIQNHDFIYDWLDLLQRMTKQSIEKKERRKSISDISTAYALGSFFFSTVCIVSAIPWATYRWKSLQREVFSRRLTNLRFSSIITRKSRMAVLGSSALLHFCVISSKMLWSVYSTTSMISLK